MPKTVCSFCSKPLTKLQIKYSQQFCSRKCKSESQKRSIIVECFACHKNFSLLPYLKREKNYCSPECYRQFTKKKISKTCIHCGQKFEIKAYLVKQGYGFYCSNSCFHKMQANRRVSISCKQCGKNILKAPTVATKTSFCSKICHDTFMRNYVTRICQNCNKQFEIPSWETDKGKGTFCSRRCYIQYKGETSIEKIVKNYLQNKNINFLQEVHIGKYHADFQIIGTKALIECDGSYWHNIPGAQNKDSKRDEVLAQKGYSIFRFNEHEIKNSGGKCIEKAVKLLQISQ